MLESTKHSHCERASRLLGGLHSFDHIKENEYFDYSDGVPFTQRQKQTFSVLGFNYNEADQDINIHITSSHNKSLSGLRMQTESSHFIGSSYAGQPSIVQPPSLHCLILQPFYRVSTIVSICCHHSITKRLPRFFLGVVGLKQLIQILLQTLKEGTCCLENASSSRST